MCNEAPGRDLSWLNSRQNRDQNKFHPSESTSTASYFDLKIAYQLEILSPRGKSTADLFGVNSASQLHTGLPRTFCVTQAESTLHKTPAKQFLSRTEFPLLVQLQDHCKWPRRYSDKARRRPHRIPTGLSRHWFRERVLSADASRDIKHHRSGQVSMIHLTLLIHHPVSKSAAIINISEIRRSQA